MSFSINGIPNIENIGTLGLYGGTTDPSGWVICDGQPRTNTTGAYNNLFLQTTGKTYRYDPTWTNYGISSTINTASGSITLTDVRGVAVSDVGTVVLADRGSTGLYISQNNGATFSTISSASLPAISFSCVDISQDGTKIIAAANVAGQGLFLSTNSGSYWSQLYTQNGLPTDLISMDNGSNKVAISNDGTKIAVAYTNGFTYFSSNSGATFQNVSPEGPTGTSLATQNVAKNYWGLGMSRDGTKLVTAVNNGSLIPDITKITWYKLTGSGLPTSSSTWWYNAMSSSGQYILSLTDQGLTVISSNYGNNWYSPTTNVAPSYSTAAMSATGQYMSYTVYGIKPLQLSTSYGHYWISNPGGLSNREYIGIGISATGKYILTSVKEGGGYLSSNYGNYFFTVSGFFTQTNGGELSISATGQYAIVTGPTVAYVSSSYGIFWSSPSSSTISPGGTWASCGISGSGQYMLYGNSVVDKIVISSNYGVTFFSSSLATRVAGPFALSYTGQIILFCNNSSGIVCMSTSYGIYWTNVLTTTSNTYVSISANAQYMIACGGGFPYLASFPFPSPGQNFISKSWSTISGNGLPATANFWTVATSYTGQYVSTVVDGGSLYLSTNYGINWKVPSGTNTSSYYRGIAMSATGEYMLSCSWGNGATQLSTSYGQYWTTSPGGLSANNYGGFTAVSGDGKYMLLSLYPGGLYISSNFGTNFRLNTGISTSPEYYGCCVSENGQYMGVAGFSYTYISSSFGAFWTLKPPGISTTNSYAISMSGSGKYVLSATQGGGATALALSVNYGVSFSSTNSSVTSSSWNQVYVSYSGKYMAACIGTGSFYFSDDYGTNWTTTPGTGLPASANYRGIAISGDEKYILTCVNSGALYTSNYTGNGFSYWLSQSEQGKNWVLNPSGPSSGTWAQVRVSQNGQYVFIANYTAGTASRISSTYGASFSQISGGPVSGVLVCAMSYSGQFILTSGSNTDKPYLSTNYGLNWRILTVVPSGQFIQAAGISGNGQYIASGIRTSTLYLSSNYGVDFVVNPGSGLPATYNYDGIAISYSGQYMYTTGYKTSNFGNNWTSAPSIAMNGNSISTSASGQYLFFSTDSATWLSTNYGESFTQIVNVGYYHSTTVSWDGKYMLNGKYFSSNYGKSFITLPVNGYFSGMSANANYMYTTINAGAMYVSTPQNVDGGIAYSTDSGNNWMNGEDLSGPYANSVAISGDGSTMLTNYYNDATYVSTNYANDFSFALTVPAGISSGLALSSTGQYGIVTQQGGSIYTSTSFGANFTSGLVASTTISDNFYGAASISQNGQVAAAAANGVVYTSSTVNNAGQIAFSKGSGTTYASNYGTTYFTYIGIGSTSQNWMNVATSSNGQYMLAASNGTSGGFLNLSTNSGAFWTAPLGTGIAYQLAWNGCAISPSTNSSGYYVMAASVSGGNVYVSINSGATWTIPSTLPTAAWSSISMDTDGSIIAVIASGSQIYISTNMGTTFTVYGSALAYTDIAVSLTGQYMAATVSSGQIYVSTSFGTTWTPYGPTADWLDIHMSGTANTMIAAVNNGPLYISTTTGQTWTTLTTTNGVLPTAANWANIGISSDGAYLVATISGGSIYTSTNGGAFWSNVQTTVTGTSAGASWSNCLAISGNGSTIVAGQSNTTGGSGLLYVSINTVFIKTIHASTWSANNIPASINTPTGSTTLVDVRGIATSDVGTVVLADRAGTGLYISQNNGLTWSVLSGLPSISFSCVDISADGSDIIAAANVVGYGLYLSTNGGSNWKQLYTQNGLPTDLISMDNGSNKVAISNDGTKIAVAYTNGFTYFSSNSGATFQIVSPAGPTGTSLLGQNVGKNYWGLGMSKDGSKLVTAVNNGSFIPDFSKTSFVTNPGTGLPTSATYGQTAISYSGQYQAVTQSSATAGIWISTNYGKNWKITTGYGIGGGFSTSLLSMSGNGQYIGLTNSSNFFTISSTYGENFRVTTLGNVNSAFSYTGQYIVCGRDGSTHFSTNYGNSFINHSSVRCGGCGISSTGQYMLFGNISGAAVSSNYGASFQSPSTGGSTNIGQVAVSGSGQYMFMTGWAANNVYVSSTYGAAFYIAFSNSNSNQAKQAYISYTGQFMFFNVYYSSNYGVSWVSGIAGSHCSVNATCQYILNSGSTIQLATVPFPSNSLNNITKSWSKISGNGLPATADYKYIQYSYTGKYVLLATTDRGPLLSTNYGNNWLTTNSGISWPAGAALTVYQVGVSSSGQYMTAVNGKALLSTNYGFNWTQHPGGLSSNPTWQETSVSGNGQYVLFMTSATTVIWLSSTSGSNFYQLTNMPVRNLAQSGPGEQVCISDTGQYIFLSTANTWPYLSTSYGKFWTQQPGTGLTGNNEFMGPAGMSLSGQYILVMQQGGSGNGNWWVSSNFGVNWKATSGTPGSNNYLSGSVSASGQYMSIAGNFFWFSIDYGVTWTSNPGSVPQYGYVTISPNALYMIAAGNGTGTLYGSNFNGNGFSYWLQQNTTAQALQNYRTLTQLGNSNWRAFVFSANGQYMLLTNTSGPTYISSNYGQTFSSLSLAGTNFYTCCISYSGQYMIIAQYNTGTPSISTTYGISWYTPAIFTTSAMYNCTKISGNGQYMLAGTPTPGTLYISTDFGNNWSSNPGGIPVNGNYQGGGISYTGQYMYAGNYISSNYGNSWRLMSYSPNLGAGEMSGTGQYVFIGTDGSGHLSTDYGNTFTSKGVAGYPAGGMSYSGQYITIGRNYSINYGATFTTFPVGIQASGVSANGYFFGSVTYNGAAYLFSVPSQNVDGGISYSTDSGNNWLAGGNLNGPYFNSVALSGDGTTIFAGYQNDALYISTGGSNKFNYSFPSIQQINAYGLALSSTGQNAIVTQQGGSVFTSTSFGANFKSGNVTDQFYGAASISQNGQVAAAAANGVVYTSTSVNTSGEVAFSTAVDENNQNFSTQFGSSYSTFASSTITSQAWTSVSISSNGQVMAASSSNSLGGYLYLSTNTGTNWSANTTLSLSQLNLSSVALSTSGQYILVSVSSSNLYVSTNTGNSWTTISNAQPWTEVAVSSDGQAMVAVGTNIQPYVSTNYGKNWSSYGIAQNYTAVSVSSTGKYMAAGTTGGQIYLSSNTGTNWAVLTNSTTANWTGISMSSTGQFIVASSNLSLYLSTNYGLAWTSLANYPGLQNSGNSWSSVSISSDGLFLVASTNAGYIYVSINGGSTWTLASSVADQQRAWQMISISGDGSKAIAIINPGQVYTSTDGQAFTFTPITMPTLTTLDGTTLRHIAKI